ncbi:MarR family winged helix-turn-helix transcriptional regulator [Larsenimonas rhizosphaerae]|uniref:MarR family winged helix-turn-helix transcriptional regulator n=1 Tax=Larsenimonas rhizosphaerae TaxID=2944682 RepID=UPI0020342613|nr:MarR family transcriptional regulator [Larsenimonas rhizosphaerae]MCM2129372.1 MarR family transcriptional regulator [Larsenimonas rhizosphaerae]
MTSDTLGDALHRLLHAYKRALRQAYNDAGLTLTVSHIRLLKGIHHQPGSTINALAERSRRDKAQITRLLHGLIAEGLIEKSPHPEDRRSQQVHPTDSGRAMIAAVQQAETVAAERMSAGLPASDIALFTRLAVTMTDNLYPAPESADE